MKFKHFIATNSNAVMKYLILSLFILPFFNTSNDSPLENEPDEIGSFTYTWWSKGCPYDVYTLKMPKNPTPGAIITCESYSFYDRVDGSNSVSLRINSGEHYLIKIIKGYEDVCDHNAEKHYYDTYVKHGAESSGFRYQLDSCD
jgi:hypothetical protein